MEFVLVQTFSNYVEANIVMGNLEAHGINCWLKDENTLTVMPIYDIAVGGIKLMVAEDQANEAKMILQHFREENKKYYHCPKCDSNDIQFITTNRSATNWLTILFTWLLGSYAVGAKQVWHCFSCGTEFEEPKGNFPEMDVYEQ